MEYIVAALIAAVVLQGWRNNRTVEQISLMAAQERREIADAHEAQVAELCNRIQLPDRAAHISISDMAPPPEPRLDADLAEELSILGPAE